MGPLGPVKVCTSKEEGSALVHSDLRDNTPLLSGLMIYGYLKGFWDTLQFYVSKPPCDELVGSSELILKPLAGPA